MNWTKIENIEDIDFVSSEFVDGCCKSVDIFLNGELYRITEYFGELRVLKQEIYEDIKIGGSE